MSTALAINESDLRKLKLALHVILDELYHEPITKSYMSDDGLSYIIEATDFFPNTSLRLVYDIEGNKVALAFQKLKTSRRTVYVAKHVLYTVLVTGQIPPAIELGMKFNIYA